MSNKNNSSDDDNLNVLEQFEREYIKILFELINKTELLDECRNQLNESLLKQQDFERELANEKRKNVNDEYQNTLIRNACDALEEERQKLSIELASYKSRHDLIVAERNALRTEVRTQALENYDLTQKKKDLESKLHCHVLYQTEITDQLSKMKLSFSKINEMMKNLRKGQDDLKKIEENMFKEQDFVLAVKQARHLKMLAEKQRDEFENRLIIKSAELCTLKNLLENYPVKLEEDENKLTNYWKNTANYLQSQLEQEKLNVETLENTIKLASENEQIYRDKTTNKDDCKDYFEKKILEFNVDVEEENIEMHTDDKNINLVNCSLKM